MEGGSAADAVGGLGQPELDNDVLHPLSEVPLGRQADTFGLPTAADA
jgi:hypothetical protein